MMQANRRSGGGPGQRGARGAGQQRGRSPEEQRQRLILLGASVLLATVLIVVLVLVSSSDDEIGGSEDGGELSGAARVTSLFEGIPQEGIAVGDPDAPVTVAEFVDLQCPFCAQFAEQSLPRVVNGYVRTGDVRLELRTLTFIGEDSLRAANAASVAAEQGELWQFADLLFANQGREGSGWVTDDLLSDVADALELDAEAVVDAAGESDPAEMVSEAQALADTLGISSTPSFAGAPTGEDLQPLDIEGLDAGQVTAELDRLLSEARR